MVPASMDPEVVRELREMELRSPGVLSGLVARFIANQRAFLADARCRGKTLDLDFVRVGAHRLKGSAGSLGARDLALRAGRLERISIASDRVGAGLELAELRAEFEAMVPVLGSLYGSPT